MEHPINCILVTSKKSIVLSHDSASLKTFAFVTDLAMEMLYFAFAQNTEAAVA
jgi:hypothetical protein